MASSNVSSVTKYFSTAAEGFSTTTSGTISAGASSVGLNNTTGLTNGNVFVGIIEPGATAQQTFTGTVDVSGSQITNVVWVRGTNVGHAGGVTVVDYVSGAAHNMMTAGILKQHTQAGAHTAITNTGGFTTDTATVTGATTLTGAVGGAGYDVKTQANSYKFSVYRNAALTLASDGTCIFDTKLFDTGNNYSTSTGKFTAPIAGFYYLNSGIGHLINGNSGVAYGQYLYKNGSSTIAVVSDVNMYSGAYTIDKNINGVFQLAQNDTVEVKIVGQGGGGGGIAAFQKDTYFNGFLVSAS